MKKFKFTTTLYAITDKDTEESAIELMTEVAVLDNYWLCTKIKEVPLSKKDLKELARYK